MFVVIEQAWGVLVNRFRLFHETCNWKGKDFAKRISTAIKACMVLHNMCIHSKELLKFDDVKEEEKEVEPPPWVDSDADLLRTHDSVRSAIGRYANRHFIVDQHGNLKRRDSYACPRYEKKNLTQRGENSRSSSNQFGVGCFVRTKKSVV